MKKHILVIALLVAAFSLFSTRIIIRTVDGSHEYDLNDIVRITFTQDEDPIIPGEMVFVAGGTFTMGDTRGEGLPNELPTHQVTLSPFYIGKYPVTQAEYEAILTAAGIYWEDNQFEGNPNNPREKVNWYATLVYCNLLSLAEDLTPAYSITGSTDPHHWGAIPTQWNTSWNAVVCNWNADGYRLPTEAEWEYAARGGTNVPDYLYAGSDNIDEVAWYWENSGIGEERTTHPIGLKQANGLELYDMTGNVWEWCWDWWGNYTSTPQTNPTGPASSYERVVRGGSWYMPAECCRITFRVVGDPFNSVGSIGFRAVRSAR